MLVTSRASMSAGTLLGTGHVGTRPQEAGLGFPAARATVKFQNDSLHCYSRLAAQAARPAARQRAPFAAALPRFAGLACRHISYRTSDALRRATGIASPPVRSRRAMDVAARCRGSRRAATNGCAGPAHRLTPASLHGRPAGVLEAAGALPSLPVAYPVSRCAPS